MRRHRCDGFKVTYTRRRHAEGDARAINRKESGREGRAGVYWCSPCGGWHVGRSESRRWSPGRRAERPAQAGCR